MQLKLGTSVHQNQTILSGFQRLLEFTRTISGDEEIERIQVIFSQLAEILHGYLRDQLAGNSIDCPSPINYPIRANRLYRSSNPFFRARPGFVPQANERTSDLSTRVCARAPLPTRPFFIWFPILHACGTNLSCNSQYFRGPIEHVSATAPISRRPFIARGEFSKCEKGWGASRRRRVSGQRRRRDVYFRTAHKYKTSFSRNSSVYYILSRNKITRLRTHLVCNEHRNREILESLDTPLALKALMEHVLSHTHSIVFKSL